MREQAKMNAKQAETSAKLDAILRNYPRAAAQLLATQPPSNPQEQKGQERRLQTELCDDLAKQYNVDPRTLCEELLRFAQKRKDALDASAFERANANYVTKDYGEAERLALQAASEAQKAKPTNTKQIIERLELAGLSAQRGIQYARAMQHFREAENFNGDRRKSGQLCTTPFAGCARKIPRADNDFGLSSDVLLPSELRIATL